MILNVIKKIVDHAASFVCFLLVFCMLLSVPMLPFIFWSQKSRSVVPIVIGLGAILGFITYSTLRDRSDRNRLDRRVATLANQLTIENRKLILAMSMEKYLNFLNENVFHAVKQLQKIQSFETNSGHSIYGLGSQPSFFNLVTEEVKSQTGEADGRVLDKLVRILIGSKASPLEIINEFNPCSSNLFPKCLYAKEILPLIDRVDRVIANVSYELQYAVREQSKLARGVAEIDSMPGIQFEDLTAEIFKTKGFLVEKTPASGDFGVDLLAKSGDRVIAIQCKRYAEDTTVGNEDILKLHGGKDFYSANESLLVTTSSLTKMAKQAAERLGIDWWDRNKLFLQVEKANIFGKSIALDKTIHAIQELKSELMVSLQDPVNFKRRDLESLLTKIEHFPSSPSKKVA